jgi:hypothetical protein
MTLIAPLLMWCALFALAAANGALREFVLTRWLGDAAQPVSGIMLIALLALASWLYLRDRALTFRAASVTGGIWLMLTLTAEILMTWRGGESLADSVRSVLATFSLGALQHGELFALATLVVALMPMAVVALRRA